MSEAATWRSGAGPRPPRGRIALLALVIVAAVVLTAVVLWRVGIIGPDAGVAAGELGDVVLVASAPDESGAVIAQVVTVLDMSANPPALSFVSPATSVSIPGTTYNTLGDAYSFGGGAGVASALARVRGGQRAAFLAVGPEALARAVDDAGGVTIELPADIRVFDGERLYAFSEGSVTLDGAEIGAVFKGAPFLSSGERAALDEELGRALVRLLAEWPDGGLMSGVDRADISTDMARSATERVAASLAVAE